MTFANVCSLTALFVALGGTSYAVIALPANSVGKAQLRSGAVSVSKLGFPLSSVSTSMPIGQQLTIPNEDPVCTSASSGQPGSGSGSVEGLAAPSPRPVELLSQAVTLKRPGTLLLVASAAVVQTGSAVSRPGGVELDSYVVETDGPSDDGGPVSGAAQQLPGDTTGSPSDLSFVRTLTDLPAGHYIVKLGAYGYTCATSLVAEHGQLAVVTLPATST